MEQQLPSYRKIDMDAWPRREHYRYYREFLKCGYSVTARLDVTAAVAFARHRKKHFYGCFLYAAAKTVNEWKSKRVRCQENGHPVWHLRSECVKEPRDIRNGGPRWTWKWIGPQDKKAQEEQMWTEHEAGNASC